MESRRKAHKDHPLGCHGDGEVYRRRRRRDVDGLELNFDVFKVRVAVWIAVDACVFHR